MGTAYDEEKDRYLRFYEGSDNNARSGRQEEIRTTPLFSLAVKHQLDRNGLESGYSSGSPGVTPPSSSGSAQAPEDEAQSAEDILPQYGLLGFNIEQLDDNGHPQPVLLNTNAPNSAFICGSQGSGKSYTLSCMLENCLLKDAKVGKLGSPITGIVFHYDQDATDSIAEAAGLCARGLKVRVLVSRSNYHALKAAYDAKHGKTGNLTVVPMLLQDHQVTIAHMLKLMSFDQSGVVPLYMEVIQRILRDMAVMGKGFSFAEFQAKLDAQSFTPGQQTTMLMRLALLKSFCATPSQTDFAAKTRFMSAAEKQLLAPIPGHDVFAIEPGTLTIIDLSDPFVDPSTACVLFDICLSIVKKCCPNGGLVIAVDEAHKFMNQSDAAENFTDHLLTTIREQRHNATRVFVATQEPTISEKLLDLCSVSIVHRFSSPSWFAAIKEHLGGASSMTLTPAEQKAMFERIVDLPVGQSLVFSPSSYVHLEDRAPKKLGSGLMRMKTRARPVGDQGQSVLSMGRAADIQK